MELKGTKTEMNLREAFAGESQARNKYTYFASVAKKEGYEQIAEIFLKTADNEKEHAKLWFKHLGELSTTADNLLAAAEGENGEWIHFDYVPAEPNVRYGTAGVIGRLCVIGSNIDNEKIKEIFGL